MSKINVCVVDKSDNTIWRSKFDLPEDLQAHEKLFHWEDEAGNRITIWKSSDVEPPKEVMT